MSGAARVWGGARRVWDACGQIVAFLLFFCAMFFGVTWLMFFPVQGVEPLERAAVTQHDGRDLALVAYERIGPRGMWQLMTMGTQATRVAAFDVATGDMLWDIGIGDPSTYRARMVGAGEQYAYAATSEGLWVLDLGDGRVVAKPGELPGLDRPLAEDWAYDVDYERGAIVALDEGGDIFSIRLDTAIAEVANDGTVAQWQPILTDSFRRSDDEIYAVGRSSYTVIAEGEWDDDIHTVTTVDTATERVIESVELTRGVEGVTTGRNGASIVITDDTSFDLENFSVSGATIVLIAPDGTMVTTTVGRSGFFGEPL